MSSCQPSVERMLRHAMEIARTAGGIHLRHFRGNGLDITAKLNESDVVTIADKEAEQAIIQAIKSCYPGHSILSEESGEAMAGDSHDAEVKWIIDPLDGTTNFSQGLPIFSVSIGIQIDGEDAIGVVFAPALNEMFHAVRGCGAFLNGKPIRCSGKTRLDRAVVATGFPVDKAVNEDNNLLQVSRIMPAVRGLRRLGSAALDLSYVAAGFLDGYWEMNLHEWDVAAGRLIATEAGAAYGFWHENRGISALAASPAIFRELSPLLAD